jgi:lipopolysaccharide transport system ATP-binding protein
MSDLAIRLEQVGKMYKIFPSRTANLLDALGVPGPKRYQEFWALRGINLELPSGRRLGIVGRNGAGKSTLLKLITGNVVHTEGSLDVNGQVQALIEAGAGFHPEFTGEENIRASLTLQGAPPEQMGELIEEIADFTELGEFLTQPFRTYSAGMQARLSFATATAIEPEILIVDEMLSAGDAYFSAKAGERMRQLVDSGASLLLVSHSLDHITMFCEEAIWVDRGQIVERGPSLEIVKSYQQFTRLLDERRIQARNRKAASGRFASHELENFEDQLVARLTPLGASPIEVREAALLRLGKTQETLHVGEAQDANATMDAYVLLEGETWSAPIADGESRSRTIAPGARGVVVFNVYSLYSEAEYALSVSYRSSGDGGVRVELLHDGKPIAIADLPAATEWRDGRAVPTGERLAAGYHVGAELVGPRPNVLPASFAGDTNDVSGRELRRWPGEGTFRITQVRTIDEDGNDRTIFERGATLTIEAALTPREKGEFPLTLGISLYRTDGLLVSNHAGPAIAIDALPETPVVVTLALPQLNLANGRYTFSVAAFRELQPAGGSDVYDLFDRSFEFEVFGNGPFENGVFTHPAEWHFVAREPTAPRRR